MSVNNKRVFYVKYLAHDIYVEIMKGRPDVRLDRLENESPADVFTPILADAHAYQIGAARDELARHFHVDKDFLKRTPNMLIVCSNGAGRGALRPASARPPPGAASRLFGGVHHLVGGLE